jgi:DNA (cytosine-5)-methyltransferase 1
VTDSLGIVQPMLRKSKLSVASLFSGAGGLDLGFHRAGFEIPWANEHDKKIWATYDQNFPETSLDHRSVVDVSPSDIPRVDGVIGGPPCQSWSEAGSLRGIEDHRGQLFFEYLRLLDAKRPKFFLAENVSGLLFSRHHDAFMEILAKFSRLGYNVSYGLLSANDYGVPQDRERVIIVGYRSEYERFFVPPTPPKDYEPPNLRDAIYDLRNSAKKARKGTYANHGLRISNHEFLVMNYSSIYMSRNRVRSWSEPSFTIQAGGRHAPIHPRAPKMIVVGKDKRAFVPGEEALYRRLTVREAARIQTFPDDFSFVYENVVDGYKMIGNAVPVEFAYRLAKRIASDMAGLSDIPKDNRRRGDIASFSEAGELNRSRLRNDA